MGVAGADDAASAVPSVASSRRPRSRLPALEGLDIPEGSEIVPDDREGHGPAWRARLPPGFETSTGEMTRYRTYRAPLSHLGADRSSNEATMILAAWLNASFKAGWVPRAVPLPKKGPKRPRKKD